MRAKCLAYLIDLINLTIFGEEYRMWSSSLCNFLHDPYSSLLGPNILNTLFSKTLTLCFSLKVRDQVSHPCTTVLYILIFSFFIYEAGRQKVLEWMIVSILYLYWYELLGVSFVHVNHIRDRAVNIKPSLCERTRIRCCFYYPFLDLC
jgi:hypothetical protein